MLKIMRLLSFKVMVVIFVLLFVFMIPITAFSSATSTLIRKGNSSAKQIALTFDAGSDTGNASKILDILGRYNVKSTFFITGQFANSNPGITRRILAQGHEIGNHSYSHPEFTKISYTQMKSQITRTHSKLVQVTGKAPSPLFRPPYGSYNSSTLRAAGEAGYKWTVMWSIDTVDWKGISASTIVNRVMSNVKPGAIVLMHLGGGAAHTPEALPIIIQKLKAKGYELVTVSKLLTSNSSTEPYLTYTVKRGDTLYGISRMFNISLQDLIKLNKIPNPNLIHPGQVLIISTKNAPPPNESPSGYTSYRVKRGDTLRRISRLYGVSIQEIVRANKIPNPDLIYIGQVLRIPVK